jgi:hypothetical protein
VTDKLQPYRGPHQNVVVYDTYADGGKVHFDVFLLTDKRSAAEVEAATDQRAVQVAERFLAAIGRGKDGVTVNRCRRCHIDDTDAYTGQLWDLGDALVWPMEGCPRP